MSFNSGRRLVSAPRLLQDWDMEAEEGAAAYWELFLDLLMVAAASAVADQLLEHPTVSGMMEFAVLYMIIINGWMLYTHHITTRFEDSSLAHSFVLFVYLMGFGLCIVNASLEDARTFAMGALLQRFAALTMLGMIAYTIPRARYFCAVITIVTVLASVGLSLVAFGEWDNEVIVLCGLWEAALVEFLAEVAMVRMLEGRRMVPVNIEQSKERLGALVLIMMGETILSVTITYREFKSEGDVKEQAPYYWVLGLSFLMVFMFTLLFFHMQPPAEEHAFRRSRFHGVACLVLHKVLGFFLLAGGVSIKLVVAAVVLDEPLSDFASMLMGLSVSMSLLTLFCMRYLHYGGKMEITVGGSIMRFGVDHKLDQIASIWWWTVGVAWLIPIGGLWTGFTMGRPLLATAFHAGLLLVLTITESSYTHYIGDLLENQQPVSGEQAHLLGSSPDSAPPKYEGTSS